MLKLLGFSATLLVQWMSLDTQTHTHTRSRCSIRGINPLSSSNERGCATLVVNCSWMNEDIDLMLNWKHVACLNYYHVYPDIHVSSGYFLCSCSIRVSLQHISFSLTFSVEAIIAISEIFLLMIDRTRVCLAPACDEWSFVFQLYQMSAYYTHTWVFLKIYYKKHTHTHTVCPLAVFCSGCTFIIGKL